MIDTISALLGAWAVVAVPTALLAGAMFRPEPYPVFDPTPADTIYRGETMSPYPLGRAELQRIVDLFDPAALVVDEPLLGYTEIVFFDPDDAVHFVRLGRDGEHGAARFLAGAETVLRVPDHGPVTLGVTLLPAWRPAREVAA